MVGIDATRNAFSYVTGIGLAYLYPQMDGLPYIHDDGIICGTLYRDITIRKNTTRRQSFIFRDAGTQEIVALMDHPNTAKVLDAGATEQGRLYFVMRLVKGVPLTDYCTREKLGTDERLMLFIDVCHGVQYAH